MRTTFTWSSCRQSCGIICKSFENVHEAGIDSESNWCGREVMAADKKIDLLFEVNNHSEKHKEIDEICFLYHRPFLVFETNLSVLAR